MNQAGFRWARSVVLAGLLAVMTAAVANRQVPIQRETSPSSTVRTPPTHVSGAATHAKQNLSHADAQLPLTFEPNRGQTDAQAKFLAHGRRYTLFLTETEVVLALSRPLGDKSQPERSTATMVAEPQDKQATAQTVLKMELVGANPAPRLLGFEQFPGRSKKYSGNDPKRSQTDVPRYAK